MKDIIFIIGCARSGTTSLCNILDQATNATFLCEPNPNLNIESRDHMDGKPVNIADILDPRIKNVLDKGKIYGEKNVTLTAFIPELYERYRCKFIYVVRDGREVVNSMYHWHKEMFGNFYRECKEEIKLSDRARQVIDNLPVELDTANYSRPRPLPDDPYYERWPDMSLHEMLCWYWNRINEIACRDLAKIPHEQWAVVNYSSIYIGEHIRSFAECFGLKGLGYETIDPLVKSKINSLKSRSGNPDLTTTWRDWSDIQLKQFKEICGETMKKLGFHDDMSMSMTRFLSVSYRHSLDYGTWWMSAKEVDHEFFQNIYNDREPQHLALENWAVDKTEIESVCDVGCGHSIGYSDFFANDYYTGIDISLKETNWCNENLKNTKHRWLCQDVMVFPLPDEGEYKYDLVFCQGTIENTYDIDLLIRRMVEMSSRYIYITAFKGYFPDLQEHEYKWNERYKSYDNKLSPVRTRKLLEELGMVNIQIFPQETSKADITHETVIIAERGPNGQ